MILVRAENLNYEYSPQKTVRQRHNKNYNFDIIVEYVHRDNETIYESVSNALQENNIDLAVHRFNVFFKDMHRSAKNEHK